MAKMIPAEIRDERTSDGERMVFEWLERKEAATENWIVFHSLGLARRPRGLYGEIDFVLIIPGEGIICLEVKGGEVSCEDGVWLTTNRYGKTKPLKKSPFLQVRESMFALKKAIIRRFGENSSEAKCPHGSGVVFPQVHCPPITPEFERWQVIDCGDLTKSVARAVSGIRREELRRFQAPGGQRLPTMADVKEIRSYLRPNFDRIVAKSVRVGRTEEKLLRLTEEQYDSLDGLQSNPRCLFKGAAGTGKTLLALEFARRSSRSGSKVALVCFNARLGRWLSEQTRDTEIVAGTWHSVMKHNVILKSSFASEFREEEERMNQGGDAGTFFDEQYPFYCEAALEEIGTPFDVLVMDEAQDLCRQHILEALDPAIPGGLPNGRWAIFGDFTRQALYGLEQDPEALLSQYDGNFTNWTLTRNCRNTKQIAEETVLLSGFEEAPFKAGAITGPSVDYRYWKSSADLVESLANVVEHLTGEGIAVEDIVILSRWQFDRSGLAGVKELAGFDLVDISGRSEGSDPCLRFSTIHSFKGLESPVVIVTDIHEVEGDRSRSLMYVAMTRARSLLILMVNNRARKSVGHRIRAGMKKEIGA